jgi:hypothetical protein
VPAIPPYIIEPVGQQLRALLPEREAKPPLGGHRPRIPDRVVFEKLLQIYRRRRPQERPRPADARRQVPGRILDRPGRPLLPIGVLRQPSGATDASGPSEAEDAWRPWWRRVLGR